LVRVFFYPADLIEPQRPPPASMAYRQFLPPNDFTAGRNRHGAGMRARAAYRAVEFPREIFAAQGGTLLAR
jgi:hypothetical protein